MDIVVNSIVESYSSFLTKKNKENTGVGDNVIVSYMSAVEGINFEAILEKLNFTEERSIYYEKPEENFRFIGIGEALIFLENGEGRFMSTCKKVKEKRNVFLNNWGTTSYRNIPLFVGGMKFNVEHSDEVWKDFNDSSWFLPNILFAEIEKNFFIVYNNYSPFPVSVSKSSNNLRKLLNRYLSSDGQKNNYYLPQIANIYGNSPKEKKKWKLLVSQAKEDIDEGKLEKVVLARRVEAKLLNQPCQKNLAIYFRDRFPGCYNFIYKNNKSIFFGATPELLVRFRAGKIEIDALAGSISRGNNSSEDVEFESELLKSEKDLSEHKFVVDYITKALGETIDNLQIGEIGVKKLNNIQHLLTKIEGELPFDIQIFNILKELHPTPAVCGTPKDDSALFIKKKEEHQRGLYSGIIGWFNYNFEGEFIVAIRSGLITSNKLFAYAGSGIVRDSDPEKEWQETELKLSPILSIFRNEDKVKS
jgi:menaquinone-specific isochorismate synthase